MHCTDIGVECGEIRPLNEVRQSLLIINKIQLLGRLDANDVLVTELANVKCITLPQREHIRNIQQPRERNDKLIDFLSRRSMANFDKFMKVLSKEQSHLVPLLVTADGETHYIRYCLETNLS